MALVKDRGSSMLRTMSLTSSDVTAFSDPIAREISSHESELSRLASMSCKSSNQLPNQALQALEGLHTSNKRPIWLLSLICRIATGTGQQAGGAN